MITANIKVEGTVITHKVQVDNTNNEEGLLFAYILSEMIKNVIMKIGKMRVGEQDHIEINQDRKVGDENGSEGKEGEEPT